MALIGIDRQLGIYPAALVDSMLCDIARSFLWTSTYVTMSPPPGDIVRPCAVSLSVEAESALCHAALEFSLADGTLSDSMCCMTQF